MIGCNEPNFKRQKELTIFLEGPREAWKVTMGLHRDQCGDPSKTKISSLVFVPKGDLALTVRGIFSPIRSIQFILSRILRPVIPLARRSPELRRRGESGCTLALRPSCPPEPGKLPSLLAFLLRATSSEPLFPLPFSSSLTTEVSCLLKILR
jgi:hypothetical protein